MTDDYPTFLNKLHGVLGDNPTRRNVKGVPVLAEQRHINFVGTDSAADKTTIAVRDDNIYIVGFTNNTGNWFTFANREQLIPRSTRLPFGGGYEDLVVGGRKKLTDIKLGKENMLQAVRMLALHHPNHPNPDKSYDKRLGEAPAKLCVMVAEAERFVPIVTVAQGWKGTPQITALQAEYVVLWGKISKALLTWQKKSLWEDKGNELQEKAKINGPDEASSTLGLLLWPTDFNFKFDAITADDDGKPLADDSSTTCNGTSCN